MKQINPGIFKHKIEILKQEDKSGEWENTITDYKDFISVWASINSLFGKEFWEAKQANLENTINITVRYQKVLKDIDIRKYKIVFDGKLYDIIGMDNPHFKNEVIVFKCIEVAP